MLCAYFLTSSKLNILMLCPECKATYRVGFTHSPDCDVDLVDSLPQQNPDSDTELSEESLGTVWTGEDEEACVSICEQFRQNEIPFKVLQREEQFLKDVEKHFEIEVPSGFRDQARRLIEKGRLDFTDSQEDQRAMELAAEDDVGSDENIDGNSAPARWRKEDATVRVWSENSQERTWMIESALRENDIHAHISEEGNGLRQVFVTPQDEYRARKIVREITEANPPK